MNTATRLGAYVLGLGVVFAGALGAGRLIGPAESTAPAPAPMAHEAGAKAEEGGHDQMKTSPVPGGLQISEGGYTLRPEDPTLEKGKETEFRFRVIGPKGETVTEYTPEHDKELHLIVARRDLSGFQHLHPTRREGVWSVRLTLPSAGDYRAFADFTPSARKEGLTLGMDLSVAGDYEPAPLPEPERVAEVDGYEVKLEGDLAPGRSSRLTLSVSKDGEPVTDLEPYLAAYGHLVALRSGDAAYLHVHPDGEPGDGKTKPGPEITFFAEVPSAGAYRLYLDFQHEGTVRTAEFTAATDGVTLPDTPEDDHNDDGHGH